MIAVKMNHRTVSLCLVMIMFMACGCWQEPVCAAESVNKESIVTDVKNPSNGVITYNVTVPPGEKIDYSVELTPDKKSGNTDKIKGSWKNKTKKTVTKTIKANVKFISNKYKITASYTKDVKGTEIAYKDSDTAVSALKTSTVTKKIKWDFSELGKGDKEWKYRYKYIPCRNGFKKYLQVFDESGKQIQNYVKQFVSLDKITKIIKEMKSK